VLEWDEAGNLVSVWGGPGAGYEWPDLEHGIYIDHEQNVWLGGGGEKGVRPDQRSHPVFRKDGTFVKEQFIARGTLGSGSVWDIAFSTDTAQAHLIPKFGHRGSVPAQAPLIR